jgi:cyclophilin family peptidyl-prolyl cis-trans isomerase/HEAT repeat protein
MNLKKLLPLLLAAFLLSACNRVNKLDNPTLQQVIDFADRRETEPLIEYLNSENEEIAEMAALKLASVQDADALPFLMQIAEDNTKSLSIRKAAVFAIGQTDKNGLMNEGLSNLAIKESDNRLLLAEIIIALGRTSKFFEDYLIDIFPIKGNELAIAQGALYHSIKFKTGAKLKQILADSLLNSSDTEARMYAANTLARNYLKENICQNIWLSAQKEQDENVLYYLLNACKSCQLDESQVMFLSNLIKNKTVNIKIATANALKSTKTKASFELLLNLLKDEHALVQEASAKVLLDLNTSEFTFEVKKIMQSEPKLYFEAKKHLLTLILQNADFQTADSISGTIAEKYYKTTDVYEQSAYLHTLGGHWSNFTWLQTEAFSTDDILIRLAAIQGIIAIRSNPEFDKFNSQWKANFPRSASLYEQSNKVFMDGLRTYDVSLCAVISEMLLDTALIKDPSLRSANYSIAIKDTSVFTDALNRMKLPRDIETYNLLLAASAKYSGKALKNKAKPEFNNPIDWQLVNRIPYHQKIQFNTTKGNFVVQLKVNEAPGTVSQIINLIKAGYFTGKYFHRVVPGFVVQAGCPRGDGFGSLMNTIRSEFSYTRYNKAGMVGMASAGDDTESSQFFVTLAPTPHLDGRYTIFGEVTSGMDVINKIVVGDKITDALILP